MSVAAETSETSDAKAAPSSGLTFPQITAGALAAATASILGSFLGVLGTIGGAAAASIITTIGAAFYQRSLERTRDKVKERLVVDPQGGPAGQVAAAVARVTGQSSAGASRGSVPSRRSGPGGTGPGGPRPPGAPPSPRSGTPMGPRGPLAPGAPRPGAPIPAMVRRGPDGRPLPPEPQLRTGGRTVATGIQAPPGVPTRVAPFGAVPNARITGTPPGGMRSTTRMPMPGAPGGPPFPPGDDVTQVTPLAGGEPAPRRGVRTWIAMAGLAASVFAIGLLASYGVESAAGHPLSGGDSGTSVGSLFGQPTGAAEPTVEETTPESTGEGAETSTSSPESSTAPSDETGDQGSGERTGGSERTSQPGSGEQRERILPTPLLPRLGGDSTNG